MKNEMVKSYIAMQQEVFGMFAGEDTFLRAGKKDSRFTYYRIHLAEKERNKTLHVRVEFPFTVKRDEYNGVVEYFSEVNSDLAENSAFTLDFMTGAVHYECVIDIPDDAIQLGDKIDELLDGIISEYAEEIMMCVCSTWHKNVVQRFRAQERQEKEAAAKARAAAARNSGNDSFLRKILIAMGIVGDDAYDIDDDE